MRRYWAILMILVLCISISGCTQFGKTGKTGASGQTVVPTTNVPPQYAVGDIVKKDPASSMGRVIQDFNPTRGYQWRTIIFDDYGRPMYYGTEKGTTKVAAFENEYRYKAGTVANPYDLTELKPAYKPKYKAGDIVTEVNNPLEGIIILGYDYSRDAYSYSYADKRMGIWNYNAQENYSQSRATVEGKYTKKVTTI